MMAILHSSIVSLFILMAMIIYDKYFLTACCICLLDHGAVAHVVVMSYRNIAFNDEAQVYIVRYDKMP